MVPLLLAATAAGGAVVYLFDPACGRSRRVRMRDKINRGSRVARNSLAAGYKDIANRGSGVASKARSLFHRGPVDDEVLVERVRAKMGRYVSHPRAVAIHAAQGEVTLSGAILRNEHEGLVHAVGGMQGVRKVHDRLVVYESGRGVPELQGGRPRPGERPNLAEQVWAPGTRLVTGAAGAALAAAALRGGVAGALFGVAGALLLARSAANKPLGELASGIRVRAKGTEDRSMQRPAVSDTGVPPQAGEVPAAAPIQS